MVARDIVKESLRRYRESYKPFAREVPADLNLAGYIDHTVLKADTLPETVKKLCEEAVMHGFYSVCVNSCYIPMVNEFLKGSSVEKAVVVGFPLGAMSTEAKAFETEWSRKNGATEFDMVINIGHLKTGLYQEVLEDIATVVKAADGLPVKVIIETCLLTDEEKVAACALSKEAGAAFVKTSTGFSTGGATVADVSLMKFVVGEEVKVKASGGVRDKATALAMIKAGADRIGTSSGVKMI